MEKNLSQQKTWYNNNIFYLKNITLQNFLLLTSGSTKIKNNKPNPLSHSFSPTGNDELLFIKNPSKEY